MPETIDKSIDNGVLIADAAWTEMQAHYSDYTVDRLLCNPSKARKVVKAVRRQFPRATEEQVCKALLNARKRGQIKPTRRGRKARGAEARAASK